MAISIQAVENLVKASGIQNYKLEGDSILYGVGGDNQFGHLIRLQENGEMFQMYAVMLVDPQAVAASPHKALLSAYLLKKMYDYKFGAFEMDDDGEIRLSVEIPLEDNTLTEKQFNRIFKFMTSEADELATGLKKILETGALPPEASGSGGLSPEAMIAMLIGTAVQNPEMAARMLADPNVPQQVKDALRRLG